LASHRVAAGWRPARSTPRRPAWRPLGAGRRAPSRACRLAQRELRAAPRHFGRISGLTS
jgi:hypothetical protein